MVTSHRSGPFSPCALRTLRAYVDCSAVVVIWLTSGMNSSLLDIRTPSVLSLNILFTSRRAGGTTGSVMASRTSWQHFIYLFYSFTNTCNWNWGEDYLLWSMLKYCSIPQAWYVRLKQTLRIWKVSSAYLSRELVATRASRFKAWYAVVPTTELWMIFTRIYGQHWRQWLLELPEVFPAERKIRYPKSGSGNWASFCIRVLCRTMSNPLETSKTMTWTAVGLSRTSVTLHMGAAMLCRRPFHQPACTRHWRSRLSPTCARCWLQAPAGRYRQEKLVYIIIHADAFTSCC